MNKEDLRNKYKEIRKLIENKEEKSIAISNLLLSVSSIKNAKTIALYNANVDEVQTLYLINKFLELGVKVCLPVVNGKELDFYYINEKTKYNKSKFNILEPVIYEKNLVDKEDIDIVIVPGIAFDVFGNRIGYGKGYYDRFLNDGLYSIGLTFEKTITTELIKAENTDKKIKIIVTEKRIIKC